MLAELGIPFERDTHGWRDPVAGFLEGTPIRKLPMLDRGPGAHTRFVYDSRVIVEALYALPHQRSTLVPPLQSTLWNPALEAQDQNVVSVSDGALEAVVTIFLLEEDGIRPEHSGYLRRHQDRARECLDWLEGVYRGRTTLTDGVLAYCDVVVLTALGWIHFRKRLDLASWSGLLAFEAAHASRPSIKSTRPV
jgi:glutathione S-transferase